MNIVIYLRGFYSFGRSLYRTLFCPIKRFVDGVLFMSIYLSTDNKEPINLELPDVWLWELIDEFIYQFQAFSQYKLRPKKTMEEVEMLKNKGNFNRTWNVLSVLNVLHSLIDISNIKKQLEVRNTFENVSLFTSIFILYLWTCIAGASERGRR